MAASGGDPKPDPGQGTHMGCKCTSYCGPDASDLFNCDYCRTEGDCGRFGFGGRWDYCIYPEDEAFEAKSFQAKNDIFWGKINADTTRASEYPSATTLLAESIQTSFDNKKDEFPSGRVKAIHSMGSICQFKLEISEQSTYTGLFEPGPQYGLIRMGSAAAYSSDGLIPGLGFKFARSGVHSGDYVALYSLDPQGSWNFFKNNKSNHIASPTGALKVVGKKFNQASQCAPQVGLSDMAKYSQDGTAHDNPRFPFKLFLIPSSQVQTPETEKTPDQVHSEMAAFPVGTKLYTVYACGSALGDELSPTEGGIEKACGSPLELGSIVTTSKCTTSKYGDEKFFIRHQRIEEDWALKPDVLEQYDAAKACGWSGPVSPSGVPQSCGSDMLDSDLVV